MGVDQLHSEVLDTGAVKDRLSIAMLGTRGVPARYGGFETCIEEVGRRLVAKGHRVVVYCRGAESLAGEAPQDYLGMELVHLPALRKRSLETLSHTGLSVAHLVRRRTDVALVFNAANAPFLPIVRAAKVPVATHVDGLEWKRAKWGGVGQRYYKSVERMSVWWSDALIADAPGIAAHYRTKFDADTVEIAYGAPIITSVPDRLHELGLEQDGYHLLVARFEPENNVQLIVDGYVRSSARLPLVVVGSAPYSDEYTAQVHATADQRVQFLGGVWDQEILNQLYAGSRTYLHGHSVGGTNPSLLRAMGAGAVVGAFDVVFNRGTLLDTGDFFEDADAVARFVEMAEAADADHWATRRAATRERARDFDWDRVADDYESLCYGLARNDKAVGVLA